MKDHTGAWILHHTDACPQKEGSMDEPYEFTNPFYQPGAKADADIRDWFGPSDIDDIISVLRTTQVHSHGRGNIRTAFLVGQMQHLAEAVDRHLKSKH